MLYKVTLEGYNRNRLSRSEFDRIVNLSEENQSIKEISKIKYSKEYPISFVIIVATIINLCLNILIVLSTTGKVDWNIQKWFLPMYGIFIFWYGVGLGHITFDEYKLKKKQKLEYYRVIVPEVIKHKNDFQKAQLKVDIILGLVDPSSNITSLRKLL